MGGCVGGWVYAWVSGGSGRGVGVPAGGGWVRPPKWGWGEGVGGGVGFSDMDECDRASLHARTVRALFEHVDAELDDEMLCGLMRSTIVDGWGRSGRGSLGWIRCPLHRALLLRAQVHHTALRSAFKVDFLRTAKTGLGQKRPAEVLFDHQTILYNWWQTPKRGGGSNRAKRGTSFVSARKAKGQKAPRRRHERRCCDHPDEEVHHQPVAGAQAVCELRPSRAQPTRPPPLIPPQRLLWQSPIALLSSAEATPRPSSLQPRRARAHMRGSLWCRCAR